MKQFRVFLCVAALLATCILHLPTEAVGNSISAQEWVQLFNGKDLTGWKSHPKSPGKWEVKDGAIVGSGEQVSHLFTDGDDYQNFHFRIEAMISDKGNSGQYFRVKFGPGYPAGYEVQINSTHSDPIRTGSLYPGFDKKLAKDEREKFIIREQLHKPDEWFTQEVIAEGNHIRILVNGKQTVDYVDKKNAYTKGHLAIQCHDAYKDKASGKLIPTVISIRKAEVKELPATGK